MKAALFRLEGKQNMYNVCPTHFCHSSFSPSFGGFAPFLPSIMTVLIKIENIIKLFKIFIIMVDNKKFTHNYLIIINYRSLIYK